MKKSMVLKLTVVAAVVAVLTGCPSPTDPAINSPGPSTTPAVSSVPEVVLSGGSVSSSSITISWIEPSGQDYAGVQISYSQTNTVIPAGTNQATLTNGIVDGVEINIVFKSVDTNGNKSAGFTLHITPRTGPLGVHFISTTADLEAIGTPGFAAGDYYVLTNDIDLTGIDWSSAGPTAQFSGVFDGNGYTVANLTASKSGGLFATASGALIIRAVLDNVDISGTDSGGVVGYGSGVSIISSRAAGTVQGSQNAGGLAGYLTDSHVIDSSSSAEVSGSSDVGGLVGVLQSGALGATSYPANRSTIENSSASGTVATTGNNFVGGLLGYSYRSVVTGSHATGNVLPGSSSSGGLVGYNEDGTISDSYATGNVTGNRGVGGLVGTNLAPSFSAEIFDSHASGAVNAGPSATVSAGGLVGKNDGTITGSYATSTVTGTGDTTTSSLSIGGLAGINSGSIAQSYSAGSVSAGGTNNGTATIGGFVGQLSGTIENSYSTTPVSLSGTSGGTIALGGFVGNVANSAAISNAYSHGSVTSAVSGTIGGFLGYGASSSVAGCYASDTAGPATATGGGTVSASYLTSSQMTQPSNFPGWDFATIWSIDPSAYGGYPYPHLMGVSAPPWP